MNGASLPRSAFFSFLLHITLFAITLWAARHSNHFVMPSPYVVTLVSPQSVANVQEAPRAENLTPQPQAETRAESRMSHESARAAQKKQEHAKEQAVEDKIAALEAKKRIAKRDELRRMVASTGERSTGKKIPVVGVAKQGKTLPAGDYAARMGEEIRQHWEFPTEILKDKNIEAVVSIRILKNGTLQVLNLERSSGIPLFDRSALRAITKASPVTPPPQEMEIGVRFYP